MPTGGNTLWSDDQKSGQSYTHYVMHVSYQTSNNVIQCPVSAGPAQGRDPQAVFIRTAGRHTALVVKWEAERINGVPDIPHSDLGSRNHVLLKEIIEPTVVDVTKDGIGFVFRIDGTYIYGLVNPTGAGKDLPTGKYPTDILEAMRNKVPASAFRSLIDPGQ